jgi:hypothetical protein
MSETYYLPEAKPLDPLLPQVKQASPVVVEGRKIPGLTGYRLPDGDLCLIVDERFSVEVPDALGYQIAWIVAQALAVGAGYPSLSAEKRESPFATQVAMLSALPQPHLGE